MHSSKIVKNVFLIITSGIPVAYLQTSYGTYTHGYG